MTAATKTALLALAEKVEKAEGPNFALECEIAQAISSPLALNFTASLDAALTLVPEGFYWSAILRDTPLGQCTGEGVVTNGELFMSGRRWTSDVFAATPALALTAAALRARAAGVRDG